MNFMSLLSLKTKTEPKYFNKEAEEIKKKLEAAGAKVELK